MSLTPIPHHPILHICAYRSIELAYQYLIKELIEPYSKESLRDAQEALTSGVISAEEMYRTLPTLGCEWERVVIMHLEEVCLFTESE